MELLKLFHDKLSKGLSAIPVEEIICGAHKDIPRETSGGISNGTSQRVHSET